MSRDIKDLVAYPKSDWILEEQIKAIRQQPGVYDAEEIGIPPDLKSQQAAAARATGVDEGET